MTKLTCCEKAYIRGLRDGGMSIAKIEQKTKMSASGIYKIFSH
jgi:hypothetical protein